MASLKSKQVKTTFCLHYLVSLTSLPFFMVTSQNAQTTSLLIECSNLHKASQSCYRAKHFPLDLYNSSLVNGTTRLYRYNRLYWSFENGKRFYIVAILKNESLSIIDFCF